MPRYDDRYGNTRLYVGHLSSRTRIRNLERLFNRYEGKCSWQMTIKHGDTSFADFQQTESNHSSTNSHTKK